MTPHAKGFHFGLKHLEQMMPSYLHFTENRPSQAKPTLHTSHLKDQCILAQGPFTLRWPAFRPLTVSFF